MSEIDTLRRVVAAQAQDIHDLELRLSAMEMKFDALLGPALAEVARIERRRERQRNYMAERRQRQ
jgi:hypothetical protein